MPDDDSRTYLRGLLGTAALWGAGTSLLMVTLVAVFFVLGLLGLGPDVPLLEAVEAAAQFGLGGAVIGSVAGAAFSGVVRLLYSGRRLSGISAVRFGVGGGLVAAVVVPLFMQTMNLLSGDGLVPMALVLDDALIMSLFAGSLAGTTMKLAQRAEKRLGDGDTRWLPDGGDPPAEGASDASGERAELRQAAR